MRLQEPVLDVRKIVTSLSSITRSEVSPRSCDTCLCSAEYLVNTFIKRDTHKTCLTSKCKFCPSETMFKGIGINSAVSCTQSVGIDHNDVLLSVSFLSRVNFRVAVGITEASGKPVLYKAFDWLVWRANIFGLAQEREECSACLSGSEPSHGKQFTLRRVISSSVLSHSLLTTLREENSGMIVWETQRNPGFSCIWTNSGRQASCLTSSAREASSPHQRKVLVFEWYTRNELCLLNLRINAYKLVQSSIGVVSDDLQSMNKNYASLSSSHSVRSNWSDWSMYSWSNRGEMMK